MSIGTPCKPDIVQLLFDESGKTVDWLQFDHGFVFTRGMSGFGTNTWLCKQQYVYKSNMEEDIDYAAEYSRLHLRRPLHHRRPVLRPHRERLRGPGRRVHARDHCLRAAL